MSLLSEVKGGKKVRPRRILLYGTSGIGKSTFGAMAPSPIFIPTEDGLGDIDCKAFFEDRKPPKCQTYAEYVQCVGELFSEPHDYKTAVTDSVDWLERLIEDEVCRTRKVSSITDVPYGKGPDFTLPLWREVLDGLDALRDQRGMTIILIAHYKVEKFKHPATDPYDRFCPKVYKAAADMIREWCEDVLFADYKVYTSDKDEGFNRTRTKGVGTGERVLRTEERPAHLAKNKLGLPYEIPLDWNEYAKFLPTTNYGIPA